MLVAAHARSAHADLRLPRAAGAVRLGARPGRRGDRGARAPARARAPPRLGADVPRVHPRDARHRAGRDGPPGRGAADRRRGAASPRARPGRRVAAAARPARLALAREDEIELLEAAVAAARRSPSALNQAEARVALGAALRRAGRRAEAREPLREARELAPAPAPRALEERAHEELVIAGARPQRVAQAGVEGLTPSERRVAELAAAGRRNREIAERAVRDAQDRRGAPRPRLREAGDQQPFAAG